MTPFENRHFNYHYMLYLPEAVILNVKENLQYDDPITMLIGKEVMFSEMKRLCFLPVCVCKMPKYYELLHNKEE